MLVNNGLFYTIFLIDHHNFNIIIFVTAAITKASIGNLESKYASRFLLGAKIRWGEGFIVPDVSNEKRGNWVCRLRKLPNRRYSYSRYWTGTSLERRHVWGNIIKNRLMSFAFEKTPRISLTCKLVPVQYRMGSIAYTNFVKNIIYRTLLRGAGCCWLKFEWSNFSFNICECCMFAQQCGCTWACPLIRFSIPNMLQHIEAGWPNARIMWRAKLLRFVVLNCCGGLAEAWKCWANDVAFFWVDMLRLFGQGFLR